MPGDNQAINTNAGAATPDPNTATPGAATTPDYSKVPQERFDRVVAERNSLKSDVQRLKSIEAKAAQLEYLATWDEKLANNPILKAEFEKVMQGGHRVVPVDPNEVEDPAVKAMMADNYSTKQQMQKLQSELATQRNEQEVDRQYRALDSDIKNLANTDQYAFLNDERDKKTVLALYQASLAVDENVSIADVVEEYRKDNQDRLTTRVLNQRNLEAKRGVRIPSGGGMPPVAPTKNLKFGSQEFKDARDFYFGQLTQS